MHIKQEGPEGGKFSRMIKRELADTPGEQDEEESAPESQGQDSGQEEDMAEDLSMAPDVLGGQPEA